MCPGEVIALEGVEGEDWEETEPLGDGTGSTELSDIRLLGRYGENKGEVFDKIYIKTTKSIKKILRITSSLTTN